LTKRSLNVEQSHLELLAAIVWDKFGITIWTPRI
jgi:hypothetical protein